MTPITFPQRLKIGFMYCLPALLSTTLIMQSYYGRLIEVGHTIKPKCATSDINACFEHEIIQCSLTHTDTGILGANPPGATRDTPTGVAGTPTIGQKICEYRQSVASYTSLGNGQPDSLLADTQKTALQNDVMHKMNEAIDQAIHSIFVVNALTVAMLVLLPYLLMGDLLAKSDRITLNYEQRVIRANANWWIKCLVALIMGIGLTYTLNPLGRGGSAYHQFFIETGLTADSTLPIYIAADKIVPVLAGFLGWYLHLIGYTFTKLIHHDVISARVYGLLFRKFIVTYGIALTVPASGLLGKEEGAAFFMFLIGLFPLSAMSMLIEAASKFSSGSEKSSGGLSQLPGISRWQILRLEEEGIDSMACLANTSSATIEINLQVMERLALFWVDIAQLYTIVGHESYEKIKGHCLTASEFIRKGHDPQFAETISGIEGVCEAEEISRLLQRAFDHKIPPLASISANST